MPRFTFDSVGGRWVVLMFLGSLRLEATRSALDRVLAAQTLFDDRNATFFGVSVDPEDASDSFLAHSRPGVRCFSDFSRRVSQLCGVTGDGDSYRPTVFLLDPLFRVSAYRPIDAIEALLGELCLRLGPAVGEEARHAPVLTLPRIFEPQFCRALIAHYNAVGGAPSGVIRQD